MAKAEDKPEPRSPRLMTHDERIARFGVPAIISPTTGILIPSTNWERANIVRVDVPWPDDDGQRTLRVHRDVAKAFQALFRAWEEAQLLLRVLTNDGTYVNRMKRGHERSRDLRDLSTHAFGAAIDINAAWNQLGKVGAAKGAKGSVVDLIPIANACGFVSGSTFHKPDWMHFELGISET